MRNSHEFDYSLATIINEEHRRQEATINLIASENYASRAIRSAMGSRLANKYAEGYPGKRYYAGCESIDKIENLAIKRCKKIFGVEHVNVQPHAGSQANMAVYFATINPGDTILGMSLAEGGHLTHGHPVNFSGKFYDVVHYKVNRETERLDYNEIEKLAHEHRPKLIIAGASAYSRLIDFERFATIAKSVGAYLLADIAHIAGLIAAKLHPSPVGHSDFISSTTHKTLRGPRGGLIMCRQEYAAMIDKAIMPGTQGGPFMHSIAAKAACFYEALQQDFVGYQRQVLANARALASALHTHGYRIVTGGTDNHLFIVDLRSKNITGHIAEQTLNYVGITVSRSCIPFDTEKPWITSGIRIGTPAITTRGMCESEMQMIAQLIDESLQNYRCESTLNIIKKQVLKLCKKFPLPT